ncbi:cupredoxin domain-containing protein [Nonomuraea basaltis]|uniref:cupredoxin domain-containing protein n=1 Tax=Nonomuraea basaltis TaxID=2495887 RepID=UPI0014870272|nr:cupredoxin domain-containing protein [Nonomuraea basaltis]
MAGISQYRRTAAAITCAATAVLLGVAGCGGGTTGGGSPAPPATTSAPGTSSPTQAGTVVDVTMQEFSFVVPERELAAGTYTFTLDNAGSAPHAMAIRGPGISGEQQSETINGGEKTQFTVTLQPGNYEVWCPVGNHRAQGMETTLTVK